MSQIFVTFCHPGEMLLQGRDVPFDRWDVEAALKVAGSALCFHFTSINDIQEIIAGAAKTSPRYFIGGTATPSDDPALKEVDCDRWWTRAPDTTFPLPMRPQDVIVQP